jgi:hypothetical protein
MLPYSDKASGFTSKFEGLEAVKRYMNVWDVKKCRL